MSLDYSKYYGAYEPLNKNTILNLILDFGKNMNYHEIVEFIEYMDNLYKETNFNANEFYKRFK